MQEQGDDEGVITGEVKPELKTGPGSALKFSSSRDYNSFRLDSV